MKITKVRLLVLSVLGAVAASGAPVWAHHGTAAFDTSKEVTVKGTITELIFSNPHVQVHWEAKMNNGEKEQWQGELTAPNKLTRAGWTKNSLKPGDQVTISGFQVKNGNRTLWIRKLIGPDGEPMQLFEE
jgi:Family of unknown function (DUF6152)